MEENSQESRRRIFVLPKKAPSEDLDQHGQTNTEPSPEQLPDENFQKEADKGTEEI